jgi:hypothetical protein
MRRCPQADMALIISPTVPGVSRLMPKMFALATSDSTQRMMSDR